MLNVLPYIDPITDETMNKIYGTLSGGKVNYYLVKIEKPRRNEQPAYQAECDDIIKALNLTFAEGCIFKEIWRTANARLGNGKPGHTEQYGKEKIKHYADML